MLYLALVYEVNGSKEVFVKASKEDMVDVIREGRQQDHTSERIAEAILRYLEFKARTK